MKAETMVAALLVTGLAAGGCMQNEFMARGVHYPGEYKWIAIIMPTGGADCSGGKGFGHATMRIKDSVLTIWPEFGYQHEGWRLDISKLNADGSGRVESSFAEDQAIQGRDSHPILHKSTFHFDPGVGPRRMIQHSNYIDRCSWEWSVSSTNM